MVDAITLKAPYKLGDGGMNSSLRTTRGIVRGEIIHQKLQPFFRWVNGESDPGKHSYFSLKDVTKAVWPLYVPLQIIGLVNKKFAMLARAWYGACWSIIYSCYRPWKENRDRLTDYKAPAQIPNGIKKLYDLNEHFRFGMGTLVSLMYGSGAFGMLWGALTDNEDLYDKSSDVYQTGMLNQNQIFASMNATVVVRRKYNPNQLPEPDKVKDDIKAKVEVVDTFLFVPSIITRFVDTLKMFGMDFGDNLQRFVNALSYVGYGTWATRFGIVKQTEYEGIGGLKKPNLNLKGFSKNLDNVLYLTQKYGGKVFYTLLPAVTWLSACGELLGFSKFARKAFKLEGILERLNPLIAAWSIRDTWMKLFETKKVPVEDLDISLTGNLKTELLSNAL